MITATAQSVQSTPVKIIVVKDNDQPALIEISGVSSSIAIGEQIDLSARALNAAEGNSRVLQSGDGEFNQLLKLNAGYSFSSAPVYAAASVGFNNRSKGFSDEIHTSLEAGLTIRSALTAALKLYNLMSLKNGDVVSRQSRLFSNNLEYFSISGEVNYAFTKNWGASLSMRGAASGQNVLANPSYSLGVFYDLRLL